MPWLALPFDDQDTNKKLCTKYGISGIPTLIIVDKDGNVLLEDGYMDIAQATDPAKVVKGWKELK